MMYGAQKIDFKHSNYLFSAGMTFLPSFSFKHRPPAVREWTKRYRKLEILNSKDFKFKKQLKLDYSTFIIYR